SFSQKRIRKGWKSSALVRAIAGETQSTGESGATIIVRISLSGLHCADLIVRISLCGFRSAESRARAKRKPPRYPHPGARSRKDGASWSAALQRESSSGSQPGIAGSQRAPALDAMAFPLVAHLAARLVIEGRAGAR